MSWSANLRILAFARRTCRALEDISDSLRTLASLRQEEWNERHAPKRIQPAVFGTMDQAAINKKWHKEQEAKMALVSEEEEEES